MLGDQHLFFKFPGEGDGGGDDDLDANDVEFDLPSDQRSI